jgi:excisionase family DNA binding protein
VLSVSQAAERLNVSASAVRSWIRSGRLRATKLAGTTYRVTEAALAEFIEHGEQVAVPPPARRAAPAAAVDNGWRRKLEAM